MGGQKRTSEMNDQYNISGVIYTVVKSRDCVFLSRHFPGESGLAAVY